MSSWLSGCSYKQRFCMGIFYISDLRILKPHRQGPEMSLRTYERVSRLRLRPCSLLLPCLPRHGIAMPSIKKRNQLVLLKILLTAVALTNKPRDPRDIANSKRQTVPEPKFIIKVDNSSRCGDCSFC